MARATEPLAEEYARYEEFLDSGYHGSMGYLAENREVRQRVDTERMLLGAKSVICVAERYAPTLAEEETDPALSQSIARYARGRDYHNGIRRRMRKLAKFVRLLGTPEAPIDARPLMDDAPILERAWAARAGLGFVGKNGLLIVPGQGSFVLLGEVLTTLELEPDSPIAERCGSCTRCLDACPTQAFPQPFVLDARRCIAYLTIELRGPIPQEFADCMGPKHLFGCDDCQTVCPFNLGRHRAIERAPTFQPHERWAHEKPEAFLDPARSEELLQSSPMTRAMPDGMARNAALVLRYDARPEAADALAHAAGAHPSKDVQATARYALAHRSTPGLCDDPKVE